MDTIVTVTGSIDIVSIAIIVIKALFVLVFLLFGCAYMIYAERRLAGFFQDRLGPNRAGPFGLIQPIADAVKNFMKEEVTPPGAHKVLFIVAPTLAFLPPLLNVALIPFGDKLTVLGRDISLRVADINAGIIYIMAISSIGVYGIVLAGWASNSKFPFLGGLRSSAQMISYEIAMGLSVMGVLMISQSLRLTDIVAQQQTMWNVVRQPLGFLIFMVAALAETNRIPFDLPEAEPELVGGYHLEYSSMKFALFFLGEFCAAIVSSCLIVTLFFGGWTFPYLTSLDVHPFTLGIIQMVVFFIKAVIFVFIFIWIRWTIPRFRYDQLMRLGWKVCLPLALANILVTGLVMVLRG